ncbi:unnamed protein product [Moneuplotes crassus]|uniref:Uncharacterized protein n=1 Tax=Euplotes crassus TaxID=5936 RepID=A0AAD1YCD1_EUPCR|nr:unnamed protein product [Moneuplotes crassus]
MDFGCLSNCFGQRSNENSALPDLRNEKSKENLPPPRQISPERPQRVKKEAQRTFSVQERDNLFVVQEEGNRVRATLPSQSPSEIDVGPRPPQQSGEQSEDLVAFVNHQPQDPNRMLADQVKQLSEKIDQIQDENKQRDAEQQEENKKRAAEQQEFMRSSLQEFEEAKIKIESLETKLRLASESSKAKEAQIYQNMFKSFMEMEERLFNRMDERSNQVYGNVIEHLEKSDKDNEMRFRVLQKEIKNIKDSQGISPEISLISSSSNLPAPQRNFKEAKSLPLEHEKMHENNNDTMISKNLIKRHQNAPIEESKCHDESESNQSVSEEPAADASEQADEPANNQESSVSMLTSVMSYFRYRN